MEQKFWIAACCIITTEVTNQPFKPYQCGKIRAIGADGLLNYCVLWNVTAWALAPNYETLQGAHFRL